jgi:hypothetical protein
MMVLDDKHDENDAQDQLSQGSQAEVERLSSYQHDTSYEVSDGESQTKRLRKL